MRTMDSNGPGVSQLSSMAFPILCFSATTQTRYREGAVNFIGTKIETIVIYLSNPVQHFQPTVRERSDGQKM